MKEIRQEIKDKGLSSDMLSFEDIPFKKAVDVSDVSENINDSLIYINSHFSVQPYKELKGNAISVFFKKVIRKLTKFYIEPVVFEQNEFNANTVKLINMLTEQSKKCSELEEKIIILEANQKNLLKQIEVLEKSKVKGNQGNS